MLIENIDDFKRWVRVQFQMNFDLLRPHLAQAQRDYLLPVLGPTLLAELNEAYTGSDSDDALDPVLTASQEVMALFGYWLAIPALQLKMDDTGLHALSNDQYKSPYQWQVGDYRESYLLAGYSAMENLYSVLMQERPSGWAASDGYAQYNESLLRNSTEFNAVYRIGYSHITYVDLKPGLQRAQDLVLRKELGTEFYDSLVSYLSEESASDSVDTDMLDIAIKKLRPALAHLAVGYSKEVLFKTVNGSLLSTRYEGNSTTDVKVIDDRLNNEFAVNVRRNAMNTGYELLSSAREWLDKNAEDFPLYLNGPGYRAEGADERPAEDRMHNTGGMMMV
jgi:hypothetical protein